MPTAAEQQQRIIHEVSDPNGTLQVAIGALWAAYAANPQQYLYAKRAALDVRLAEEQRTVDVTLGSGIETRRDSQAVQHLQQMRADVQADIIRAEGIAGASRAPVTGALTTQTPLSPLFPGAPDTSDPYYNGSPYGRRRL